MSHLKGMHATRLTIFMVLACAPVWAQQPGLRGAKTVVTLLTPEIKTSPGHSAELKFHFKLPKGIYIDRSNVAAESVPREAWVLSPMITPRGTTKSVAGVSTEVLTSDFEASTSIQVPAGTAAGQQAITIKLFYVTCTGNVCLPHNETFNVTLVVDSGGATATESGPGETAEPPKPTSSDPVATGSAPAESTPATGTQAESTFLERLAKYLIDSLNSGSYGPALAAAFLGGILLAMTPCVLPMIPIVVKVLVGGQESGKSRRVLAAIVYTIGLSLVYATLGWLAGKSGGVLGAVLQNRLVLVGFAVFFGVLALSMFGLFELQVPPRIQAKLGYRSRGDLIGAFVMGMISGLIASPCIGPVILFVLTWIANTKNETLGFIVLFTMGVGLGSPFIAAAFVGGRLLKPGNWMIVVKKGLGVLLLLGSAYFINLAAQWTGLLIAVMAWAVIGLATLRWLTKAEPGSLAHEKAVGTVQNSNWAVVAMLLFGVTFNGLPGKGEEVSKINEGSESIEWRHDYDAAMAQARTGKLPAMIYFTADWCLPCKELKHTAWIDPGIVKESKRFVCITVDMTHLDDPKVEAIRKKYFNVNGPPIIFFHDRDGNLMEKDITEALSGAESIIKRLQGRMESIK